MKSDRPWLTVHWCFYHSRREWSDAACPEDRRWRLRDGTSMKPPAEKVRRSAA